MKQVLIILVLGIAGCESGPTFTDNDLHVTVKCFGSTHWTGCYYISYSKGFHNGVIMDAFDISGSVYPKDVVYQEWLSASKAEAIAFAKKFDTYESIVKYSDSVALAAKRMKAFRDKHPIPITPDPQPDCCTEQKIR